MPSGRQRPGIHKLLLSGYVNVMEKARSKTCLPEQALLACMPSVFTSGKAGRLTKWDLAPAHAAEMLLLSLTKDDEGDEFSNEMRGQNLRLTYRQASEEGALVTTPGRVRDLKKMVAPLTRAMAIDRYLREEPTLLAPFMHRSIPLLQEGAANMTADTHNGDTPWDFTAMSIARKCALDVTPGQSRRYAAEEFTMPESNVDPFVLADVRHCACLWDGADPAIQVRIKVPLWYTSDLEDLVAVIYTEGLVKDAGQERIQLRCDAVAACVDEVMDEEDRWAILTVRPMFGEFALLYQFPFSEAFARKQNPVVKALIAAPGIALPH